MSEENRDQEQAGTLKEGGSQPAGGQGDTNIDTQGGDATVNNGSGDAAGDADAAQSDVGNQESERDTGGDSADKPE